MPSAFDPDSIWVSGTDVRKVAGDPGSTTPIRDTATGLGKVKIELDELIDDALRNVSAVGGALPTTGTVTLDFSQPVDLIYPELVATDAVSFAVGATPREGARVVVPFVPHANGVSFSADLVPIGHRAGDFTNHNWVGGASYTLEIVYADGKAVVATSPIQNPEIADNSIATNKLEDDAVTPAKQSHGTADTLLGYDGSGVPGEITAGSGITITGGAINGDLVNDATPELDGTLGCLDNVVNRPELQDYSETSTIPAISGGTLTLDLTLGNVFEVTLGQDVTTLNLSNPPASGAAGSIFLIIRQDGTGGWSITWPSSVQWPGGTAPGLTGTASSVDIVSLVTRDGGTTWYGFVGGLNFS